jgi:hypothetical protein
MVVTRIPINTDWIPPYPARQGPVAHTDNCLDSVFFFAYLTIPQSDRKTKVLFLGASGFIGGEEYFTFYFIFVFCSDASVFRYQVLSSPV